MRPNRLGLFAATLCLGCATVASADQSTTQMNVSLTKELPQVTVSATTLEFGTTAEGGEFFATSTIHVNAPGNTSYRIALDRGLNVTAPVFVRHMGPGPVTTRTVMAVAEVPYHLYSDAGRTSPWGDDGVTFPAPSVAGLGTGADQEFPVFGHAIVDASLPTGTYIDIVTVSVNF